jgi:hypothetical protein
MDVRRLGSFCRVKEELIRADIFNSRHYSFLERRGLATQPVRFGLVRVIEFPAA